jgi:hypothetical protein
MHKEVGMNPSFPDEYRRIGRKPSRRRGGPLAVRRRWSDVAAKVVFGTHPAYFAAPPLELMYIKRLPAGADAAGAIAFWSEKHRRRIVCESGAELRVFSWLERSPEVRWYQEQPLAVPYACEGRSGRYYPDAAVLDGSGRLVVVEVKSLFTMYLQETVVKATAALKFLGPRGIGYLLVEPGGRTLADIARASYDRQVAETVESFFVHGPVPFRLVRNLLVMRHGRFERAAFAAMVVNRDWAVISGPRVRIWRLPEGISFRPFTAPPGAGSVLNDPVAYLTPG